MKNILKEVGQANIQTPLQKEEQQKKRVQLSRLESLYRNC